MYLSSLVTFFFLLSTAAAVLQTYTIPDGIEQSTAFDVKVRSGNSTWQSLQLYQIGLHEINTTTGSVALKQSTVAYFDFSRTAEVTVQYKNAPGTHVRVRPDSYHITPTLQDGTATFSLSKPANLVVQFNDEIFDCLHLLAGAVETYVPSSSDPDVMYYGPGIHGQPGDVLEVSSGKTVYLAGGAILQASVVFNHTIASAIRGRGMIYRPKAGIQVAYANDTLVEGITLINTNIGTGQADGIHIRDVKSFSGTQWGDGMDFYCSRNVLVEGVFFRNSDDCIAIYNHRDAWIGDSKNITVRDSSLWADVAHPVNIGTHGNTQNPETISDLTLRNIDILDHREAQVNYQGCIAINPGNSNLVRNVLVEDIRVEDFRLGQLLNMRVMFNSKYNTSPGRGIQDVVVRDVTYKGSGAQMSVFSGYNETRGIRNVSIQGLTINGKAINDGMKKPGWYLTSDFIPAFVNEHVANLTFPI